MPNPCISVIPIRPINRTRCLRIHRILHAVSALLLLQGMVHQAWSESPYNPEGRIDAEQFILPWDGPGAAVFNPAWITETKRVDGRFALSSTVSGKDGKTVYQGSGNTPWGIAVGFNQLKNNSDIDGSNAVYEEATRTMMLAWGGRDIGGTGIDGGAGFAYVRHDFNAFGAVRTFVHAWDFGIQASAPARWMPGRLHSGLTLRNYAAEKVRLPEDNPGLIDKGYKALLINVDAFFLVKSAFDVLDAYLEFNFHQDSDASEGPARDGPSLIKSMGLEYRPFPYAGVKIERTWLERWSAGLVGHVTIPVGEGIEFGAEANLSHDRFLSPKDEGRGYLWSLALNAGM